MVNQYVKHIGTYHHVYEKDREDEHISMKLKERLNPNFYLNHHVEKFSGEQLREIIKILPPLWNKFQAESFDKYLIPNNKHVDPTYENAVNRFLWTMRRIIFSNLQLF